jgi:hypothetical protein
MKQIWIVACVLLLCIGLAGCDDDTNQPSVKEKNDGPAYKDLTEKWHTLYNLRLAYNTMDTIGYRTIFDADNFVFFFYEGDVGGGGVPVQWGFAQDSTSAHNMFNQAGGVEDNPIVSIDLFLHDIETVEWWEIDPGDGFPGETWYQTIVVYDYFIDTAKDIQYITQGAPTSVFTVRQIDGKWKLVWWRDRSSMGRVASSPSSTEETTWGGVKALYQ